MMQHFVWQQDKGAEGKGKTAVSFVQMGPDGPPAKLCPGPAQSPEYSSRVFSLSAV